MSDDASARLGLPYLAAGQLQKHVTLNEALTRLDALTQTAVVSRTRAAQPATPADGALYILPASATGASWAGRPAGSLMRAEAGGWLEVEAPDGLLAVVLDSQEVLVRRAGTWAPLAGEPVAALQNLTRLGVNTEADAANVVAARLNKALWTALESESGGDGDLRFTFNKQGAPDVLSLLFQSGWGGRAELGLIGDDDLRLKVSADGGSWRDVFAVDRVSGRMGFMRGATRRETTVMTGNGVWTPPLWARWIEAVAVGGGGGGGAGVVGASGAARPGGGGGGAGGAVTALWPTEAVVAGLTVVVGGGGAGGTVSGASGAAGLDSVLTIGGVTILRAEGGRGGATSGLGGVGGVGAARANGGGSSSTGANAGGGQATDCSCGSGGGGAGGGVSAANVAFSGGNGGDGAVALARAMGGAGRATSGLPGQVSPAPVLSWAGGGGGGGGGNASGGGGDGAAGGLFGAGGGGGGAATSTPGAGGAGAAGVVWLTAIG
ncbi:DUF2793 domain-containing protein [Brevundimonas pondensis]|uniref:DUF2793 domain-containing protein n=1 Tax=Brevundimonas pondensis TaxID=2774189 RepID=UPI00320ADDBD